jgi:adenylate cyclase
VTRSLTLQQLADETDTDPSLLSSLTDIGVLHPGPGPTYIPGDIIRVESARSLLDAGLTLDDIATAVDSGLFTFEFLDRFHPEPAPRTEQTVAELAKSLGIDPDLMSSMYLAMGLPEPASDHRPRHDEEEVMREFVSIWGVDREALLRAARLVGEPARIVSDGWARLFVEKISTPLTVEGVPVEQRIATIAAGSEKAAKLAPRMLDWLLQRHMRHAIDRVNIEGFEQTMAEHGMALPVPERLPAITFVDVSGYTRLTEAEGDELAVRTSETIRDEALATSRAHGGTLVKILGDGAMLHFDDVNQALVATVELVDRLTGAWLPVHAGVHAGSLIEHDGDYYGHTVNIASRVAGQAGPGEVVVTEQVVDASRGAGFSFTPMAPTRLKGIEEPVGLFRVSMASTEPAD